MQTTTIKLWCNSFENPMYKALVSTLLLDSRTYVKANEPEVADLWCLVDDGSGIYAMSQLYDTLTNKPKVIYLARSFQPPPVPEWVFFKSPIHATALFNWIKTQQFSDTDFIDSSQLEHSNNSVNTSTTGSQTNESTTHAANEGTSPKQRWYREPFKLQYWPNVTQYSDSPDIIALCTKLLRDWMTYDALLQSNLSSDIIEQLLSDAEYEQNLFYKYNSSAEFAANSANELDEHRPVEDDSASLAQDSTASKEDPNHHSDTSKSEDVQDKGWGFFKNLLNRFVN